MNPKPTSARNRQVMTEEDVRAQEHTPQWPSPAFKRNYRRARERLGCKPTRQRYPFPRLSKFTHMHWKFGTFEQNFMWIWEAYVTATTIDLTKNRALVMARLISQTFGIALKDLRGQCRDATITMPRMIGMAMLRHDGISYPAIRAAFHKDPKTIAYAAEQMRKYTGKLDARSHSGRYPSIRQSTGRVQTHIPEVATEDSTDAQARSDRADGGFDGGEGSASGDPCK